MLTVGKPAFASFAKRRSCGENNDYITGVIASLNMSARGCQCQRETHSGCFAVKLGTPEGVK